METNTEATSYTCIVCGEQWGGNEDNGTSGICIKCFAKWALKTYNCFGDYKIECMNCKIIKYCKEYHDNK